LAALVPTAGTISILKLTFITRVPRHQRSTCACAVGARSTLFCPEENSADALPEVPALGDFVPGYEASQWYGLCVTKNTPMSIVDLLNREINIGLVDP
jgi:hypothetical protein